MGSVTIGGVAIAAGEKKRISLGPVRLPSGTRIEIPCIVARGARSGPTLVVSGATHGDEIVGTAAVIQLMREIDPASLAGTLIGIPVVNIPAFDAATYLTPYDHRNMASPIYWEPKPEGTLTERLGASLSPVYRMADGYLDLHGNREPCAPMQMLFLSACKDDDTAKRTIAVADAFGLTPVDMSDPVAHPAWLGPVNDYAVPAALANGIPALMVELTKADTTLAADIGVRGCRNVMKHLGMIEGSVETQRIPALPGRYRYWGALSTQQGGLLWPQVDAGTLVRKGQTLVEVTDLWGDVVETIASPEDGFVWRFHGAHYGSGTHVAAPGADIGFFGAREG